MSFKLELFNKWYKEKMDMAPTEEDRQNLEDFKDILKMGFGVGFDRGFDVGYASGMIDSEENKPVEQELKKD